MICFDLSAKDRRKRMAPYELASTQLRLQAQGTRVALHAYAMHSAKLYREFHAPRLIVTWLVIPCLSEVTYYTTLAGPQIGTTQRRLRLTRAFALASIWTMYMLLHTYAGSTCTKCPFESVVTSWYREFVSLYFPTLHRQETTPPYQFLLCTSRVLLRIVHEYVPRVPAVVLAPLHRL